MYANKCCALVFCWLWLLLKSLGTRLFVYSYTIYIRRQYTYFPQIFVNEKRANSQCQKQNAYRKTNLFQKSGTLGILFVCPENCTGSVSVFCGIVNNGLKRGGNRVIAIIDGIIQAKVVLSIHWNKRAISLVAFALSTNVVTEICTWNFKKQQVHFLYGYLW